MIRLRFNCANLQGKTSQGSAQTARNKIVVAGNCLDCDRQTIHAKRREWFRDDLYPKPKWQVDGIRLSLNLLPDPSWQLRSASVYRDTQLTHANDMHGYNQTYIAWIQPHRHTHIYIDSLETDGWHIHLGFIDKSIARLSVPWRYSWAVPPPLPANQEPLPVSISRWDISVFHHRNVFHFNKPWHALYHGFWFYIAWTLRRGATLT